MRRKRRLFQNEITLDYIWTRQDFRNLALIRLEEARILLRNKKYDGAYYLCGYSVECALKACIANQTEEDDFPPKRNVIEGYYSHEPSRLMKSAGLEPEYDELAKKDKKFERNWNTVQRWNEESRYRFHTERKARDLYNAITNKKHGVLSWVKRHW